MSEENKVKILVQALAEISGKKLSTINSPDPAFREGANEGYKRAAEIADEALASTGYKSRIIHRL